MLSVRRLSDIPYYRIEMQNVALVHLEFAPIRTHENHFLEMLDIAVWRALPPEAESSQRRIDLIRTREAWGIDRQANS